MNSKNPLACFFLDALRALRCTSLRCLLWTSSLLFLMVFGLIAYLAQVREGLIVSGMSDYVGWGIYIANFTFLVGLAAAAVMVVLPAYVLKDVDFDQAVMLGEGVAVSALVMCLAFVTVDLGSPHRIWHMIPKLGYFHFPQSLLAWDVLVLNGYLLLNVSIPFYVLFCHYRGREPDKKLYLPLIIISIFWAVSIHLVTAFLYAGLPARPFWHSALLGPRFLASAFSAGPAFIILTLALVRWLTPFPIRDETLRKLALITTVAAQINLIMMGSELYKEFYMPTADTRSIHYLFFGLHGHNALRGWIWTSITLNLLATAIMSIHPLRRNFRVLYPTCVVLFVSIWMEKGIGLIVPGFIPSPLEEMVEYFPSRVELAVTAGIWALGLFVLTALIRVAIPIELGRHRLGAPDE